MMSSTDNSLFESSLLDEQDNEVEQFESNTSFEMDDENKENNTNVSFWCILKLITPEWKIIAIASICSILCGFAMPALGVIFGNIISIISDYNTEKVIKELKTYTLTLLCIGIFLGVGNFIMVFSYSVAGETLTERIRITMFKNLLQQEMAFYDEKNNSSGVISAVLSDEAAAVQGGTAPRIATIMQTFGAITLAMIISFWYQWKVGLVALAFLSILAIILYMQEKTSNSEHQFLEASTKIAADVVSNIRTVVSLGREEYFLLEYSMELLTTFFNAKKSMHWRGFISGLSRGFHNFIYAGTIYYGAILIVEQKVNYSHVFISAQALVMGTITASQAFAFTPNFKKGMESARRVITLLKRKSKITDPIVPFAENYTGTGEAYLYRVKFRYPTRPSVPIFENLELNIDQGKTIALVGPNGCGKSTVLQLLERFYDPDKGIVAKDQYPLVKLRLVDVRRGIGLVQREPVLFDGTIRDNIAYGDNLRSPTMNEIVEAAKKAHIHQFIFSLPAGYHTQIGPRGVQLSVGQKQRIAIARALISQPKLLLLDEATSALDVENEKIVQQALKRAKARCTCVVVAHRLSTIHNADVIYVLKNGAVAESGTHDELISSKGLYYTLSVHGQT